MKSSPMEILNQTDRVRAHTPAEVNREIDLGIEESLRYWATQSNADITRRIEELESEWDTERMLETNASLLALAGLTLGVLANRKWLALPAVVFSFLLQHALQGWCPPIELFRRLRVRTRREIDAEKTALKALRGDFRELRADAPLEDRVREALQATVSVLD
jgi:hypothetical protein